MKKIIITENQDILRKKVVKNEIRINENFRLNELFKELSLTERENVSNKTSIAIDKINNGDFETPQNPSSFSASLKQSRYSAMLSDYSESELGQMKLFKLQDLNIGFALKQFEDKGYSEIVAVHNNEPEVKGVGELLMKSAIKNGGKYLDHFDGYLSSFYGKLGFKEYKRDKYDPQYDPDQSFSSKYGEQDVIYRKL